MLASKKALQVKAIVSDEVSVAGLKQLDKHSGFWFARQQHVSTAHTLFADSPEG